MHSTPSYPRRGSVLLVSLLFSAIIALSIASFLRVATNASKISYRTYYLGAAMNIAETGLEQAMWSVNRNKAGDINAWAGWEYNVSTTTATRTINLGAIDGGANATVKVLARERVGSTPEIIARSIITPPQGRPIEKWVRVTLNQRSIFNIGGLGRLGIDANGNNVYFGSWNSDPDNDPTTPYIPFSEAVKDDNMTLATLSFSAELDGGNSGIGGSGAVGADSSAANFDITDHIKVGPQGFIGPTGTPNGTMDPDSVSADFTADLDPEVAPDKTYTALGQISGDTELPTPTDIANGLAIGGVYYYTTPSVSLNGDVLSIAPGYKVVLKITDAADAISLAGNGGAIIVKGEIVTNTLTGVKETNTGELKIYAAGDINVSGQGEILNEMTLVNHTPATNLTKIETVNVTVSSRPSYGNGKFKNTIVNYWKDTTTVTITQIGTAAPTTTSSTSSVLTNSAVPPTGTGYFPGTPTNSGTVMSPEVRVTTGTQVGQPKNLLIYGTRTEEASGPAADDNDDGLPDTDILSNPQIISISGNGQLSAVVYAPNGAISAKGGGNSGFVYGSLIGYSLTLTGNSNFYYDESLANLDVASPFGIDQWQELVSAAERNTHASLMNF